MDCDMHHTVSCLNSTAIIFTTCQIFPLFQCGCTYSIVCQRRECRDTSSWARGRELARFGRFCWFDFACCSWILHDTALKGEFCRWLMLSTKRGPYVCEEFHSHLQICLCGLTCFLPLWWASYLNVTGSALEHWNFKSWHLNWSVCVGDGINAVVIVFTVVVVVVVVVFKSIMNDTLTRH